MGSQLSRVRDKTFHGKYQNQTSKMGDCTRLCALIFALIFPPISVLLVRGCGCDFLLNIILTLLAYIPGDFIFTFFFFFIFFIIIILTLFSHNVMIIILTFFPHL